MSITGTTAAERRARGLRNVNLWLPLEVVRKLDEICEAYGYSRAEILETMVETDWDEWRELTAHVETASAGGAR